MFLREGARYISRDKAAVTCPPVVIASMKNKVTFSSKKNSDYNTHKDPFMFLASLPSNPTRYWAFKINKLAARRMLATGDNHKEVDFSNFRLIVKPHS